MVWPGAHGIWYGLAGIEWSMVWLGRHDMMHSMEYGMAWWASHGIWLLPGRQGTGLGIVYGMA